MERFVNSEGFDMNAFDADRVAAREAAEEAEKKFRFNNSPNVKGIREAELAKRREAEESQGRRQEAEDLDFKMRVSTARLLEEEKRLDEKRAEEERLDEKRIKEERRTAMLDAQKRYYQHNAIYRVFHKSVYKMNHDNMSIEEIDNLYGGKAK